MKIVINDEPIDFTLQGETSLGEIVPTLEEWLGKSHYAISQMEADGKNLLLESRDQWRELPIEEIETLSVTAGSVTQQQLEKIETAAELLSILRRVVDAGDAARLAEGMAEYEYLREVLPGLLSSRKEEGIQMRDYFDELLTRTGARTGTPPATEAEKRELLRGLDSLLSLLEGRGRELVSPEEEFLSVARAVAGSLDSIEEVPVLLQTGKGNDAMRRLAGFTGLVERLVRLYPSWAAETGRETEDAQFGELNEVLGELIQALGDEDSVLVGDLVEYEIVPKVEDFLVKAGVARPESARSSEAGG